VPEIISGQGKCMTDLFSDDLVRAVGVGWGGGEVLGHISGCYTHTDGSFLEEVYY